MRYDPCNQSQRNSKRLKSKIIINVKTQKRTKRTTYPTSRTWGTEDAGKRAVNTGYSAQYNKCQRRYNAENMYPYNLVQRSLRHSTAIRLLKLNS